MAKNRIEIVYEDDQIIVINKPSGINLIIDRSGETSLIDHPGKQKKELQGLKIVHQLDKDASGITILAKNADAHRKFLDYFKDGQIRKIYLAIITGSPCEKTGVIDAPLAQSKKDHRITEVDDKHGKDAQTQWELLADFSSLSLLAVRPIADRMHQIQVHLRHANMPLAIDSFYGQDGAIMLSSFKADYRLAKFAEEKPLIDKLTLCAYQLEIPVINASSVIPAGAEIQNIHLVAPLEKKFKATIKMLTKYNQHGLAAFNNEENFNRLLDSRPLLLGI